MGTFGVVKIQIITEAYSCYTTIGVVMKIDFFVLDCTPKAFDKNIVESSATPVHTDQNPVLLQHICPVKTGKLRSLIRVENQRLPNLQSRKSAVMQKDVSIEFDNSHDST